MVGGLIQKNAVGAGEHHAREHAAHLLAAGEHLDGFEHVVAGEEHPAQEAPQIDVVLFLGEGAHPVHQGLVVVLKVFGVVLGEVAAGGGDAPLDGPLVGLQLAHQQLEHHSLGQLVLAHEGDLFFQGHFPHECLRPLLASIGDFLRTQRQGGQQSQQTAFSFHRIPYFFRILKTGFLMERAHRVYP